MRRIAYEASATVDRGAFDAFVEQLRAAAPPAAPRFDVSYTTRKRLAPVLVIRRARSRVHSHLRERFELTTMILRGYMLVPGSTVHELKFSAGFEPGGAA